MAILHNCTGCGEQWAALINRRYPKVADQHLRMLIPESIQKALFLRDITLRDAEIRDIQMPNTHFLRCKFVNCFLTNLECEDSLFEECTIEYCKFLNSRFDGSRLFNCKILGADFSHCNLDNIAGESNIIFEAESLKIRPLLLGD